MDTDITETTPKIVIGSKLPKPTSLAGYLSVIDSRKALEVEHYLRACALRLDLIALPPSTTEFN